MYPTEFVPDPEIAPSTPPALSAAIRDVVSAAKELLKHEAKLARAEVLEATQTARVFSKRAAVAGALMGAGLIPLMAFFVLVLGAWWGERYWLSSLVVAVIAMGAGALMFIASKRQLADKLTLPTTRDSIDRIIGGIRGSSAHG